MKSIKSCLWLMIILSSQTFAWKWIDAWQTRDQQGMKLLQAGKPEAAATVFKDKNWQGVSNYRSGQYTQAFKQFNAIQTSDAQYNAGNAATLMGHYQNAILAYDKAIALNPKNTDAIANREIVKKLLQKQLQQNENKQKKEKQKKTSNKKNDHDVNSQNANNQNQEERNQTDKQKQSEVEQKNSATHVISEQLGKDTSLNQSMNMTQKTGNEPKEQASNAIRQQQRQAENNKQLLRRLSDESFGLLQRKFLRDYARRHHSSEYSNEE